MDAVPASPVARRGGRPRKSLATKLLQGTARRIREPELRRPAAAEGVPEEVSAEVRAEPVVASRDFVAVADAYARSAVEDEAGERFGALVRLAAKRYFSDRARAERPETEFVFVPAEVAKACAFVERCPHVEGRWATREIVLHPSQIFFIANVFGFRKRADPEARRFSVALFAVARKNAKTTLAAALLLYALCEEREPGAQVISAATTGSQARIIFGIAKRMVESSYWMRRRYGLAAFANAIVNERAFGSFKPINAKASTQDGLNPSHCSLDEIHAHKTPDLLNVLQSAAGARSNPLWLYTTTEGYDSPGPWHEIRTFAQQVLAGAFAADHFFALFYGLDDEIGREGEPGYREADSDFDEDRWIKANPLIDEIPMLAEEIRKAAIEAKAMPGRLAEFRIKRLNRRSSAAKGWIDLLKWQACSARPNLDELRGAPAWGGLDLASTTDLCAFRIVWRKGGRYYTWGRRYVPEAMVRNRTERGTVPYAAWVESGLIVATPGNVVDYAVIERDVIEAHERFGLKEIAFDRWNATELCSRLLAKGLPMVEFRQGSKSYHPAMQALERQYVTRNLEHGGDPVLTWCAANLVPRYDPNMNMAPDRVRSADKIDDVVALLMAFGRAAVDTTTEGLEAWLANPVHV